MKYFAYGSNMHPEQMRGVCPGSRFVTIGKLPDYRLDFTRFSKVRGGGVADIVHDYDSEVWGVVYAVPETDLDALDEKEGVAGGAYERKHVEILTPTSESLPVMTYSVVRKKGPFAPKPEYSDLIVGGARYWSLPQQYVTSLIQYVEQLINLPG